MHLLLQNYLLHRRSGPRFAALRSLSKPTSPFRQVTYDLAQVDPAQLFPLRDTIIAALEYFKDGPRPIILQLCLALSGLALQLPTWTNAVEGLIDSYGQNPAMVPVLLQFLTVLPEELYSNTKIPVTVGWSRTVYWVSKLIPLQGPRVRRKECEITGFMLETGPRYAVIISTGTR